MTFPSIYKCDRIIVNRPNESSPFVKNGQVLLAMFARNGHDPEYLEIRDFRTGNVLKHTSWDGIFGCAIVVDGTVHIFGASAGAGFGNRVIHSTLDDNFNPSVPSTVWQSNPACDRVWNTSVAPCPGGFVMAMETAYNGVIFMKASSINGPWTPVNGLFDRATDGGPAVFVAACPTIRYYNGNYYVFYLGGPNSSGHLDTKVARSPSVATGSWQFSPTTVLTAAAGEGINNSDLDWTELNGFLYGCYFDGDQSTWLNVRRCLYQGTEAQFLQEFF